MPLTEKTAQNILEEMQQTGRSADEQAAYMGVQRETVLRYLRLARRARNFKARILLLDIETAPLLLWTWGLFKQHPQPNQIEKDWCILSWAAKWLYEPDIIHDVLEPKEAINRDDNRILKSLWIMFDKADIIIAHNAVNFDVRKIYSRFLTNNLLPPSPYTVIDTLRSSRRLFAHPSHTLDYLTKHFKLSEKLANEGLELWKKCCRGNKEALNNMIVYNIHDIYALEDYYLLLRPWIPSHPNVNLYLDQITECRCTRCGSTKLKHRGKYVTPAGRFASVRCNTCGGYSRERIGELTKKERDNLLIATAR